MARQIAVMRGEQESGDSKPKPLRPLVLGDRLDGDSPVLECVSKAAAPSRLAVICEHRAERPLVA